MASNIGKMDTFEPGNEEWACYKERLDQYLIANDVKDDRRVATFLSLIGPRSYRVVRDIATPELPSSKSYADLCDLMQQHFDPKPLVIAERFRFYKRDQHMGESVNDFHISLRKLATHCNFGATLNESLRDRFVCGLLMESIQKRLLAEKDLTLEKALKIAVAMETAVKDVGELRGKATSTVNKLKFVPQQKQFGKPKFAKPTTKPNPKMKPCYRCLRTNHKPDDCKFKGATCHKCKKKGHISPACKPESVHAVEETDEGEEYLFNLKTDRKPIMVKPVINGIPMEMELDTGSGVSVIPKKYFEKHWKQSMLEETSLKLKTYSGEVIKPIGAFVCDATVDNRTEKMKLYVTEKGERPLFGREWFNTFKLNWTEVKFLNCDVNKLKERFPEVFKEELGCLKDVKAKLTLEENASPRFIKARPVPFALKPQVEEELDKLVNKGVLEKVDHSEWATPVVLVPKANGDIRICGDYKVTVNPVLKVDQHPLPKVEEIFANLAGGKKFSKVDLKEAYHQIEMDEESKRYLTINTHKGLFRYNRLVFGIASAPAIFQRTIETVISGIPGVQVILDDIIVTGKTEAEHMTNLETVLSRLQIHGFRVNATKCSFFEDEITYCGHVIDGDGLHKTEEKIEAIVNAPKIENVHDLRSFLGLVQYYGKFLKDLSTVLHPLHRLLRKDVKWNWTEQCEEAVKSVKKMVASEMVLTHYDPTLPLMLACDASSYGLGCVLSHMMPNGEERPIAFASRTLNEAEKKYSQIDKEALGIVWGVKKFNIYLLGRHFTLVTDHKPLLTILHPHKGTNATTAARLQRYALFLAGYQYDIQYKNTKLHGNCDSLSRLPLESTEVNLLDETELYQASLIDTLPVTASDIARETRRDKQLSVVYEFVSSGANAIPQNPELKAYANRLHELSLHQECLLWGTRVIIPAKLQKKVLEELHEGHLGMVKMKSLARSYVWWPKIDQAIETLAKSCAGCMNNKTMPPESPIHPWEFPKKPWSRVHVDFAGPFMGYMFFVMVDAYSKWPIVKLMKKTTTAQTIEVMRRTFADNGICDTVVSDNGPQFSAEEFEEFMKRNGIKHIRSAPYHPRTNGLAERFVQSFKQAIKAAKNDSGTLQTKLSRFLLQYRSTTHATTNETPALLFMGRNLTTKLDRLKPSLERTVERCQSKMVRSTRDRFFDVGQTVKVRDYRSTGEKWVSGTIDRKTGPVSYRVEVVPGVSWKRHTDQIRDSGTGDSRQLEREISNQVPEVMDQPVPSTVEPDRAAPVVSSAVRSESTGTSGRRYPVRERRQPKRLIDEM